MHGCRAPNRVVGVFGGDVVKDGVRARVQVVTHRPRRVVGQVSLRVEHRAVGGDRPRECGEKPQALGARDVRQPVDGASAGIERAVIRHGSQTFDRPADHAREHDEAGAGFKWNRTRGRGELRPRARHHAISGDEDGALVHDHAANRAKPVAVPAAHVAVALDHRRTPRDPHGFGRGRRRDGGDLAIDRRARSRFHAPVLNLRVPVPGPAP